MYKKEINPVKKALVVTTVASTLDQFCMNNIYSLQKTHVVHVAANFSSGNNTSQERVQEFKGELHNKGIVVNELNLNRNPLNKDNILAYSDLKRLIDMNSYEIIHCHTPVAAMIVRMAARHVRKNGIKVIYTAHGFHFYKGAPYKNWLLYYPVEHLLAKYTDVLITINHEDFERAKNRFKAESIKYVPGIGIDLNRFQQISVNKLEKRKEIGVPEDSILILSVGELNKNKNHETVIKAIAKLNNPNVHYVICGQGVLEEYLKGLIKELNLEKQIKLLGYRKDVGEICKIADLFVFPSFREGLSVAMMEAMASGLPIICSNIRGNVDLVMDQKGGYHVKPDDVEGFWYRIKGLIDDVSLRNTMGKVNMKYLNKFDEKIVNKTIENIYKDCIGVNRVTEMLDHNVEGVR